VETASNGDARIEQEAEAADARTLRRVGWRLVLWAGGSMLAVLLVLGTVLYGAVARSLEASGIAALEARAGAIAELIEDPRRALQIGVAFGGRGSGTFALVLRPDGRPLALPGMRLPAGLPDLTSAAAALVDGRDVRVARIEDVPVRILSERVTARRLGDLVVQVVGDRTAEQRTLDVLRVVLLVGSLLAAVAAGAAAAWYARWALVPVRDALAAQRAALRRQRQFAADASHELRTPLAVIASAVEYLRRHPERPVGEVADALDDIGAETGRLGRLVDDLLLLARSDSGAVSLERLPVDLGAIAEEAVATRAKLAAERGVAVEVRVEPSLVEGDAARLRRLVGNLLDNAIRHAPPRGHVWLRVGGDGSGVELVVEDDGPGIRPEHLPRVFDRFWRAPGAPGEGSGLGLAIAAWIVERHGGRIAAANRPAGGARFSVWLPRLAVPTEVR
jgi:signal transduction histidine kinase